MSKSERTKRRKLRQEINVLRDVYLPQTNSNPVISNPNILLDHTTPNPMSNFISQHNQENNMQEGSDQPDILNNNLEQTQQFKPFSIPQNNVDVHKSRVVLPLHETPAEQSTFSNSDVSIQTFLAHWSVQYNIPHNALNGLLRGLKKHDCFNNLPIDCRTIFNISNISKNIRSVELGHYHHFGLANGIKLNLPLNVDTVKIVVGIDGLPISKSSSNQFWPILAYIEVEYPLPKVVFLVGLYYGKEKPRCSNDFLLDFAEEAKELITHGILINSVNIKVIINVFCCDAPAKSFILKVKGHSGFSSCTRCKIEGEYIDSRVCFPYTEVKSTNRDHFAYMNTLDEDFHVSDTISNLVELPNFDAVYMFSLDYLHLVNIGVMKKLFMLWVNKGPLNVRLRSTKINELSKSILELNPYITSDFVRKGRSVQELCRWKATEYRLFLLYTGPIILKNIISEECYSNFMSLNIAMLILLSPNLSFLIDYAKQLLDFFVLSFQNIYGQQFVSHNVHGLLHLYDDYIRYGPLDNCSTFVFENYMKELKSFLRKHDKPLQQVINRYHEKYSTNLDFCKSVHKQLLTDQPLLKQPHTNGPLPAHLNGLQYYTLLYKTIKIKIKEEKNCYILPRNNDIVKCLNFCQRDDDIIIIGQKFKKTTPLYEYPINSTLLDIFEVQKLSKRIEYWTLHDIKKKLMVFVLDAKCIAMPVIHTDV